MQTNESCLRYVCVDAGLEPCRIHLMMCDTGRGFLGGLLGGESPHVGGVVLATPRESLQDAEKTSCDIYSIPVSGHLDNEMGKLVAKQICVATNTPVSITAGIHVDNLAQKQLEDIKQNCQEVIRLFLEKVFQESSNL